MEQQQQQYAGAERRLSQEQFQGEERRKAAPPLFQPPADNPGMSAQERKEAQEKERIRQQES